MPFNGSNTFTIVNTFVPGTTILSSAVNTNFSDIATGLSDCVTRDAQGAVTGNLLFSSTGFVGLPSGTTAQRPNSALAGYFRFNSTSAALEVFDGAAWDLVSNSIDPPQGYLTLTNLAGGGPITSADVISATSVYYSPFIGQECPLFNGTTFVNQIFSEQTLSLVAQHTANGIFDVFAFLNGTVFTIATGPVWTVVAAGSCARGTGAGTTQLQRLNGVFTNQQSITARNGATTYTIAANQGTYLGSIFIDGVNGQVTCHVSYGQSRKWGVWNAYNRNSVTLLTGDSTGSWTANGGVFASTNNSAANACTSFCGLPIEPVYSVFLQSATAAYGNNTAVGNNGIGLNVTNAASGFVGTVAAGNTTTSGSVVGNAIANFILEPIIGINTLSLLEKRTNTVTNSGGIANCLMTTVWRG